MNLLQSLTPDQCVIVFMVAMGILAGSCWAIDWFLGVRQGRGKCSRCGDRLTGTDGIYWCEKCAREHWKE